MLTAAAVSAVLCIPRGAPACGAQPIPPESFIKLQNVFSAVCDHLWEVNDAFWHDGDYERCIATLRLITEINPHDTEAFANAAWLIWNADRIKESEALLKKGIALNSDVDDLYFELGFFYYNQGRFEEAIEQLETAVTFQTHWTTWHLLAHAYERAGYIHESLNIWFIMEARDPTFPVPGMQIDRILSGEGYKPGLN